MSDRIQNLPESFNIQDTDTGLAACSATLAELSDYVDDEQEIVRDTSWLLTNLDSPINNDCQPTPGILQELAAARSITSRLADLPAALEPDPYETFRDEPTSRFTQTRTALLKLTDECTTEWWRDQTPAPASVTQRARSAVVDKLLGHLSESYGLVQDGVTVGSSIDYARMQVVGEVPTDRRELVGKVARVVHTGFSLNSGEQWRPADVHRYVDELTLAGEALLRNANLRVSR